MAGTSELTWQASLLDAERAPGGPAVDGAFRAAARHDFDSQSWVDHVPGWVRGAGELFDRLVERARWEHHRRRMYDRVVDEPRLTANGLDGDDRPLLPALDDMRAALDERYGRDFDSIHLALYRDGRDSVAWHSDRIARTVAEPVIAVLGLGEPRRFLLRPKGGGGRSRRFPLGAGDLLVMGGATQVRWEHSVPKVARAGARMSVSFRHSR